MIPTLKELGIECLSVSEKMELAARIWDSISDAQFQREPIPDSHKAILKERIAEADDDPNGGIRWEQALERLRSGE